MAEVVRRADAHEGAAQPILLISVSYSLAWGQVWPHLPYLLAGAWLTLALALVSFFAGFAIGLSYALALRGPRALRWPARAYTVFFLNTPLLVQVFFLFFVLPDAGILLSPFAAVAIGMSLNAGAYLTEILRAGLDSVRAEEIGAAQAMNFSRTQVLRIVVLPHVAKALYPALSNQFIIQVMTTSLASVFAVQELTGRAYDINSITFRSFEIFSIAAVAYIALTLLCSLGLAALGRWLFRVKARIV